MGEHERLPSGYVVKLKSLMGSCSGRSVSSCREVPPTSKQACKLSTMANRLFLLVLVALLFSDGFATNIRCYSCTPILGVNCSQFESDLEAKNSLKKYEVECKEKEVCYKNVRNGETFMRTCGPDIDADICTPEGCICQSNLCNGSNSNQFSAAALIFGLLVGVRNMWL